MASMATKLSDLTHGHKNNFTLIRFIAATLVLFSHSFSLSGEKFYPFAKFSGMSLGIIGLDIFFFVSGFLVTASLLIRREIFAFAWARFLRIYPALFVAVIFSISVGAYFTSLPLDTFLNSNAVSDFFIKNITLVDGIRFHLPGVFADNPKHAVNGSLWTLPWELKMYFVLFVVGGIMTIKQLKFIKHGFFWFCLIITATLLALLYLNYFNNYQLVSDVRIKPGIRFGSLFFAGALFYVCKDRVILSGKFFLFILIAVAFSFGHSKLYYVLHYLFLGYVILYLAYVPKGRILKFNSLGDYSYGLYIYAFPIQQSVIAIFPNLSGINIFYISFITTLILAVLSWHFLEKKVLMYKSSYLKFKDWLLNLKKIATR